MSTKAQAVLEQIKALPDYEQREILRGLDHLKGSPAPPELSAQLLAIQKVRGMFAGGGLRQALLDERARDRLVPVERSC